MSNPQIASVFTDTGVTMQIDPLFHVPGLMPVTINSVYLSNLDQTGPLGWGRVNDLDPVLRRLPDGRLEYRDAACMAVTFQRPTPNPGQWNRSEHVRFMEISAGHDRSFILREEGRLMHFAKSGQKQWNLVAVEALNGARLEYTRDGDGLLEAIDMPEGVRLEFDYDAPRRLRTAVWLVGRDGTRAKVMQYAYDEADNLIHAECLFGDKHLYRYASNHLRVWAQINDQHEASFSFDSDGRALNETTNGPHNGTTYAYDDRLNITTLIPAGDDSRTNRFYHREDGAVFAEAHVSGRFKRTSVDVTGQITAEQDGNGNEITYRYAPTGELTTITDEEKRTADFRWNDTGKMEFAIDPTGATWTSDYDEFGNLIATSDALGHQTELSSNEMGQPVSICRHDGLIQFRTYDSGFWLTSMIDFDGIEAQLTRDTFGRITSVQRAGGDHSQYEYGDQLGADFWVPSVMRLADGVVHETRWDVPRREVVRSEGQGREVTYLIDGFGKVEQMRETAGQSVSFNYDQHEDLCEVVAATGARWQFERDGRGRIVHERDFSNQQITYTYDDADHLVGAQFSDGTVYEIARDKSGLVLEETVRREGEAPLKTRYSYDDRGLAKVISNDDATVAFERDANGRVIAETTNGVRVEIEYDCCGRRVGRNISAHSARYEYDGTGRLRVLAIDDFAPMTITRDHLGHETTRSSQAGFALQQRYNAVGLLLSQEMADSAGSGLTSMGAIVRQIDWNAAAEPTRIQDGRWGETQFDYTGNGQVARARFGDAAAEAFSYDSMNTLVGAAFSPVVGSPQAQAALTAVQDWSTGAGGKVEQAVGPRGEDVRLRYDDKGQVVKRQITRRGFRSEEWRYTWRADGRLGAVHTPQGHKWTYGYDPFGRRLWKEEFHRVSGTSSRGTVIEWQSKTRHDFVWDGDVIARETIVSGDKARTIHWYHDPETFIPLARLEDGALSYVVTDHLGTPREVVSQNGALEWAAEFRTWGSANRIWRAGDDDTVTPLHDDADYWTELRPAQPVADGTAVRALADPDPDPAFCPIRFQGQWADAETGLHYNRHRYYDPLTGAYLSPDPIGLLGGFRPFGYVARPTGDVDPNGLNAALRRALGMTTGNGLQAHHVIPKELWYDSAYGGFFDDIGIGGDRDIAANGIGLPNNQARSRAMGLPYHCGSHPIYTADVARRLQPIADQYNDGLIDAATARQRVGQLQDTLRSQIRARPGGTRIR